MNMTKTFKVGDMVVTTAANCAHLKTDMTTPGTIYRVVDEQWLLGPAGMAKVKETRRNGRHMIFPQSSLSPAFKVGDRVQSESGWVAEVKAFDGHTLTLYSGGFSADYSDPSGFRIVPQPVAVDPKPAFKAGDKVVSTTGRSETGYKIEPGTVFEVVLATNSGVIVRHLSGPKTLAMSLLTGTFKLATEPKAGLFIVILFEDGVLKPASKPYQHGDKAAAETEAARLAEVHQGQTFAVFEMTATAQAEEIVKTTVEYGPVTVKAS
jgi:hypothetical protein